MCRAFEDEAISRTNDCTNNFNRRTMKGIVKQPTRGLFANYQYRRDKPICIIYNDSLCIIIKIKIKIKIKIISILYV